MCNHYVGFHAILSKHAVTPFTNSVIVTYSALPCSNKSILCRAESVTCRLGWPLDCSWISSVFSEFDTRCFAKYNFNAVLKFASTKHMICRRWIFLIPAFFSSIMLILFAHRSFLIHAWMGVLSLLSSIEPFWSPMLFSSKTCNVFQRGRMGSSRWQPWTPVGIHPEIWIHRCAYILSLSLFTWITGAKLWWLVGMHRVYQWFHHSVVYWPMGKLQSSPWLFESNSCSVGWTLMTFAIGVFVPLK